MQLSDGQSQTLTDCQTVFESEPKYANSKTVN